jgi:hypothetical protein
VPRATLEDMDTSSNVLLLHAELAWCDVCAGEQLLMPTDDAGGLCCTVCDAAVFVISDPWGAVAPHGEERRSA